MTVRIAITFGQKYNPRYGQRHPASSEITGTSYVVFEGDTWEDARQKAIERLGTDWAFDYLYDERFTEQIAQYGLTEVKLPCPDCSGTGALFVGGCTCGAGTDLYGHEPGCGLEPCHCDAVYGCRQ